MFASLLLITLFCLTTTAGYALAANIFYCSYRTNLGQLHLVVQSGSTTIKGTYPSRTGSITGTIKDGVLRGKWRQAKSKKSGYFYMVFDRTGNNFKGKWAYRGDTTWRGDWTGHKIAWTQDKGNVNKSLEWFDRSKGQLLGVGGQKLKNVSPDQCARACLSEKESACRSFDYHKTDRSCELTSYEYPNASYIHQDRDYDLYERGHGLVNVEYVLSRTICDPPDPSTLTVSAVAGGHRGPQEVPNRETTSSATSGKWYSLAYSRTRHYWYATYHRSSKEKAAAWALKQCNARAESSCETIATREHGHVSIVVSKKWNVYRSGHDDKQCAFDYCYNHRGPCYLLVRVGPSGVVERNSVDFRTLRTSTGRQPGRISPRYEHYFARNRKDLWNGLLSDVGRQIDRDAGNRIASTVLSMFKNPERPRKTRGISLDMRFDSDCSAIRRQARPILNELGNLLREQKDVRIIVRGHNSGDSNMVPLSLARARSVKAYLVKNFDINPERIKTEGLGNTEPLVRERTREAALVNQRVDIEMLRAE